MFEKGVEESFEARQVGRRSSPLHFRVRVEGSSLEEKCTPSS